MNLFQTPEGFMPHGHCYLWRADVLWLNVVSDLLIFLAYVTIPILLVVLFRKSLRRTQRWVLGMFSLFIFFCGITHLVSILTIWIPAYHFEAIMKAITASLSIVTAVLFFPVVQSFLRDKNDSGTAKKNSPEGSAT